MRWPTLPVADACRAAGDDNVQYLDTTGWYNGPLYPNIPDGAALAEKLVNALKAEVLTLLKTEGIQVGIPHFEPQPH